MKKLFSIMLVVLLGLTLSVSFGLDDVQAKTTFVTIGTGGITGVYYPTGGAIAKIVNNKRDVYGIRCTVESTGGSVFNVNAVMSGDLDFGVVQSDRQYQAINGLAEWEKQGKQEDLRAVFSIHPEAVTLVAAADAGIKTFADLKGKRVNIGNIGSGQRQNSIDAFTANGMNFKKDIKHESIKAAEAPGLLQDGRIDAFFYTVGHPAGAIKEATAGARKTLFISVPNVDELTSQYPYYVKTEILKKYYESAQNTDDVETFGVKATFVTSAKVPDDVVYAVTKEIFENFEDFKTLHSAYENLTKEEMLTGLSAPIHPGAMKYYKEAGLMK
jgi:TRAP transporter TAXI family solute receptor